jgi:hypothetical protein
MRIACEAIMNVHVTRNEVVKCNKVKFATKRWQAMGIGPKLTRDR